MSRGRKGAGPKFSYAKRARNGNVGKIISISEIMSSPIVNSDSQNIHISEKVKKGFNRAIEDAICLLSIMPENEKLISRGINSVIEWFEKSCQCLDESEVFEFKSRTREIVQLYFEIYQDEAIIQKTKNLGIN